MVNFGVDQDNCLNLEMYHTAGYFCQGNIFHSFIVNTTDLSCYLNRKDA